MRSICPYVPFIVAVLGAACADRSSATARADSRRIGSPDTVVVFLAASLTGPLRQSLAMFSDRTGTIVQLESGASLEHARKITDLGRVPDVIALADVEVFPELLMPAHVDWYAEFARNRMVVAYTDRSRHAAELDSSNWFRILAQNDVEVGRTDPDLAPAGYRTILMLQLAERHYRQPGLAELLLRHAPRSNMRGNAAELAALLEAGEIDYMFDYQSIAITHGFRFLTLPSAIDLGDPDRAADYATVSVRVRGNRMKDGRKDSVLFTGRPIVYALSVPRAAPHPRAGFELASFLLSSAGRRLMRDAHVDALDHPLFVGANVPETLRALTDP